MAATAERYNARTLLTLRSRVAIVHHLPGRIRLRARLLDRRGLPRVRPGALRTALDRVDVIRNVRVNAAAATAVIDYDPSRLPAADWEILLRGQEADATKLFEQWLTRYPGLLDELMMEERR